MMYMSFFDMFYYTDRVSYRKRITRDTHPMPEESSIRLSGQKNGNGGRKKELDYNCAVIVYALHQMNTYERGVNMDYLKCKIDNMMKYYPYGGGTDIFE